jgi:hypothetical protein
MTMSNTRTRCEIRSACKRHCCCSVVEEKTVDTTTSLYGKYRLGGRRRHKLLLKIIRRDGVWGLGSPRFRDSNASLCAVWVWRRRCSRRPRHLSGNVDQLGKIFGSFISNGRGSPFEVISPRAVVVGTSCRSRIHNVESRQA